MVDEVQASIKQALGKLRADKVRIDRQISALDMALAALDGRSRRNGTAPARRKRMSAAAREALGRRMKAYWAKRRAAAGGSKRSK